MRAIYWAIAVLCLTNVVSGREWTSNVGTKVEGELVSLEGDVAVLQINSEEKRVPLDRLSPVDQAFARQRGGELDRAAKLAEAGGLGIIRTWKDKTGAEVEAKFGEVQTNMVVLLVNRKPTSVAYAFLNPADQMFVRAAVESKLNGTWLFPTDEGATPARRSFGGSRSGLTVYGTLVGIDHNGNIILNARTGLQAYPATMFSVTDEAHIREEFKIRGLGDLLPRDTSAHEYTDWKGEKFRARLDPVHKLTSYVTLVYFAYEGTKFTKSYQSLCEADQRYLRELAVSKGIDVARWPQIVPDPSHPLRTWTFADVNRMISGDIGNAPETTLGAFISFDRSTIKVRGNASDGVVDLRLERVSLADRRYLEELLETENNKVLPIVSAHCVDVAFDFHEGGQTNISIYPVEVSNGEVSGFLPENGFSGLRTRPCTLSLAALTRDSIDRLRQHLQVSNPNQVVDDPPITPSVNAIESRSWNLKGGETARGALKYVSTSYGRIKLDSGTRFVLIDASPADQAYVSRAILDLGYSRFEEPPPPPPKPREPQVARSTPNTGRGNSVDDWSPPSFEPPKVPHVTFEPPQPPRDRGRSRNQTSSSSAFLNGYKLGVCLRVMFGFAFVIAIVIAAIKKLAG